LSTISTQSLLVVGIVLAIIGIVVVAIPFASWTDGAVAERQTDILGWVLFGIGIVFVIIWAIFFGIRHH
jgi:uncharacterized membrane protein YidH (DUF202 family)